MARGKRRVRRGTPADLVRPRLALAAAALVAVAAKPASAQVTPVVAAPEPVAFAAAGDATLVARVAGRRVEVRRAPGGALVHRVTVPRGHVPSPRAAASASTAALVVVTETRRRTLDRVQAFVGPVAGPLAALGRPVRTSAPGFAPVVAQVDGDRTFLTEVRTDFSSARILAAVPGAPPATVPVPADGVFEAAFTGDLVAFAVGEPGQGEEIGPQRLVVRDWRTGADRWTAVVPEGVDGLDVHPDGRVLVARDTTNDVVEVPAGGGPPRVVAPAGARPAWAGDSAVFVREGPREGDASLMVAPPGAPPRPFGVPSTEIEDVAVSERRVVWRANGCVLSALVDAPAAGAPDPGSCPRSELAFDDEASPMLRDHRRVPLLLRCVAAPPPGCRGTVRLVGPLDEADGRTATAAVRYVIPAGTRQRVTVRLTRRAYRLALREARRGLGAASFTVRAVTVDPAGRRHVLRDGLSVEGPGRG